MKCRYATWHMVWTTCQVYQTSNHESIEVDLDGEHQESPLGHVFHVVFDETISSPPRWTHTILDFLDLVITFHHGHQKKSSYD